MMRAMQIRRYVSVLISLSAILVQPASLAMATDAVSKDVTPSGLYNQAWTMVRDTYYDPTYNGQDWNKWAHRYDGKLKTIDDAYKATETMLTSLGDQYTRFLQPAAFKDETNAISAKMYGIGLQIAPDQSQKVVVVAPMEGTPAEKAGFMPLDEIIEVDGKPTKGLTANAVSQMIRGPMDTQVTLKILRNGKEYKTITLTRAEIHVKSVQTAKMLDSEIGYFRLSTFMSETAGQEVRDAISKLSPARGIIFDLRGDPGGLVTNALDVCNNFLFGGIIVSTVDRNSKIQSAFSQGHPFYTMPIVILINHGSASASEITSGALHDNQRAELVGETSFGKGLMQSVNRLPGGSGIHITIARYLTPSGTDINKKGIKPDYEVKLTPDDYRQGKGPWWTDPGGPTAKRNPEDLKDIQLQKAVEVLRDKLENKPSAFDELKLQPPVLSF